MTTLRDALDLCELAFALQSLLDCIEADNPNAPENERTYRLVGPVHEAIKNAYGALGLPQDLP